MLWTLKWVYKSTCTTPSVQAVFGLIGTHTILQAKHKSLRSQVPTAAMAQQGFVCLSTRLMLSRVEENWSFCAYSSGAHTAV